jgi:hypothetical protein|nr:MAG TPA: hypothetical protein [Caudoviricetes sp.]
MKKYGERLNGAAKGITIVNIYGNTIWINKGIHQEQAYNKIEEELTWEEIRRYIYEVAGKISEKLAEINNILESPAELTLPQIVDLGNMEKSLERKLDRLEEFQQDIKIRWKRNEIKTWRDVNALKKVHKIL